MFGVVLWSDRKENKAVIWCEDHGDLAFYRACGEDAGVPLDTGDWVQFDLTTERNMRFARNPRLVAEGAYPGIAEALGGQERTEPAIPATTHGGRNGMAEIIPFRRRRAGAGKRAVEACSALA